MNSSRVATPIFLNALKSLQTIGNPKSDTVKKLLNRLNQVFDFAVINGYLENSPTRILSRNFEKNFIKVAPIPRKAITDIEKFKTLISSINEYWGDVNVLGCMKWTMLYALRPSNARFARWEDINTDKKEWIIKADDMKMKEEFIIPLTDTAIELLKTIPSYTIKQGYLFRGAKHNAPISYFSCVFYYKAILLSIAYFAALLKKTYLLFVNSLIDFSSFFGRITLTLTFFSTGAGSLTLFSLCY